MSQTTKVLVLANWVEEIESASLNKNINYCDDDFISFALGLPDANYFPTEEIKAATNFVLDNKKRMLQYHPPLSLLKDQIVEIMALRGVECHANEVVITQGAQQAILLLAQFLLDKGSKVLVEDLTYTGFLDALRSFEPNVVQLVRKDNAFNVEELELKLKNHGAPRLLYLVADGNNPFGTSLSFEQRCALARIAEEYHMPIVEDDPYGLINYGNQTIAPVKSFNPTWVFYVGTLSKIIAPSLRVGWVVVPEKIASILSKIKEMHDLNVASFSHWVMQELLLNFDVKSHLDKLKISYKEKRDAMLFALKKYLPVETHFQIPECGFFIWVTVPGVDAKFLEELALKKYQLAIVSSSAFSPKINTGYFDSFRLNFSYPTLQEIEVGVIRLSQAIKESLGYGSKIII